MLLSSPRSPSFRVPWTEDVGPGSTPAIPQVFPSLCTPVHWGSLFGAAGISPSPESPLESGQESATAASDRASMPEGMRAPGTWKVFGKRMRSGRRQLYTGTLTNKFFADFHLSFDQ